MTQAQTNKSTMYIHNITMTDVTTSQDRRGRPYAKWTGTTIRKTGKKAGKEVRIFGMAFGKQYEELREMITVGATNRFGGFYDSAPADPETGLPAISSFILNRLMPLKPNGASPNDKEKQDYQAAAAEFGLAA